MLCGGTLLFASAALTSLLSSQKEISRKARHVSSDSHPLPSRKKTDCKRVDVLMVGAGPAGSTAAYFLGQQGYKVALCDRKKFPRQKVCGDAWCKPALDILEEMGVMKKMEDDGICHVVKRGGLISPFGYECINTDGAAYGTVTGCKTYAIKRQIADEYLVRAAAGHSSVELMEECEVTDAIFIQIDTKTGQETEVPVMKSTEPGIWRVHITRKAAGAEESFVVECSMLLICDGTTSYLGQKLGVIPKGSQPEAVCSHSYIRSGTHNWTSADGVMIFTRSVLPGYSALFRHYNGDVYFGTYILPGGRATATAIAPFEAEAFTEHPYIKAAVGDHYEYEEKRVVAPIRLGGIPQAYARQLLLVGDAAGHVDPLTGEGIHTAMIAGKLAAITVDEMHKKDNFSLAACKAYELRCYDAFVHEFLYSSIAARVVYYLPIAIDAVTVVGQRRGQGFLDFFGEVMTGVKPKSAFLQADIIFDITVELVKQFVKQYIFRAKPLVPKSLGVAAVEKGKSRK